MKRNERKYSVYSILLLCGVFLFCMLPYFSFAEDGNISIDRLDKRIKLRSEEGTIYQLFRYLSEQYDCMFIYDSEIIENNKKVKINKGKYSLREAIYIILGNKALLINIAGQHVVIRMAPDVIYPAIPEWDIQDTYFLITGNLRDKETNAPVPHCLVEVVNSSVNAVSNQDGDFSISIHDSLRHAILRFTHMTYTSLDLEVIDLAGQHLILTLNPKIIVLPNLYFRAIQPLSIVRECIARRPRNYSSKPVYMNTFYREGIEWEKENIELTEAVFKLYKDRYAFNDKESDFLAPADMVKLEKMRTVIVGEKSTKVINFKIKSGIRSALQLDIIKYVPDFLDTRYLHQYVYSHVGNTSLDNRDIYVIAFRPLKNTNEAINKGYLYIDAENYALVQAHFEIDAKYRKEATKMLVVKHKKSVELVLQCAEYTIMYKEFNGTYYLNYVRADLRFNYRKKRSISHRQLSSWIEMHNSDILATDVKRFDRNERLPLHAIFSNTEYVYDRSFWENFNVIIPEERLLEPILSTKTIKEIETAF